MELSIASKLRHLTHIMRKKDVNLKKCIITGLAEGARGKGRLRRAWCDYIKDWTNPSTEDLLQSNKEQRN